MFSAERQDRKCWTYWCKPGMLLLGLKLRHLISSKENRIVHAHTHAWTEHANTPGTSYSFTGKNTSWQYRGWSGIQKAT